jgi:flagellar hook protein FlgE
MGWSSKRESRDADRQRRPQPKTNSGGITMSITSALYTGVSGLVTNGEAMNVIGNNIANVNTVGFKGGRTIFSDMLSANISNTSQVGRGVQMQGVQNIFDQGSFESTQSATDLAIQGDSFFVVADGIQRSYTKAGSFTFDKSNVLVNPDGYQVQGYGIDPVTKLANGALGKIDLSSYATLAPFATTSATVVANLDASSAVIAGAIDPTNPATYSFSTSMPTYDALGQQQSTTLYYQKTAANTWNVNAYTGATQLGGDQAVTFNTSGIMTSASPLTFGALSADITGTTQYVATSSASSKVQDGYPAGTLTKVTVDAQGYVNALYSNSQQQRLAQIALAKFPSVTGLSKAGGTRFEETFASGQAQISTADNSGMGKVFSNTLELSNVDMAAQFVKMIVTQRAYSANSKTITTTDEMTQEALNLKR